MRFDLALGMDHKVLSLGTSLALFICHTTSDSEYPLWINFPLNNKKRSHTQLDSRKQVIVFQDRVITINIKEAQHPLK